MNNKEIIKTLKKDISELKELSYKYSFSVGKFLNKYELNLIATILENDSIFKKSFRTIQFKTSKGLNDLIVLINKEFKENIQEV